MKKHDVLSIQILLTTIAIFLIWIGCTLMSINDTLSTVTFPREYHYNDHRSWDVEALVPGSVIIEE
jgi:hypothetical protein